MRLVAALFLLALPACDAGSSGAPTPTPGTASAAIAASASAAPVAASASAVATAAEVPSAAPTASAFSSSGDSAKACAKVAEVACSKLACGNGSDLSRRGFRDAAHCQSITTAWCTKLMTLPDTGATPEAADACTAALLAHDGGGCETSFLPEDVEPCLFKGRRGNLAACSEGAQCTRGWCGKDSSIWAWPDGKQTPRGGECQLID